MITLPDVDSLMAGGLGDWLDSQQAARAETRTKIRNISISGFALGGIVALAGWAVGGFNLAYFLGALIAMGTLAWAAHLRNQMIGSLKIKMNGALADALDVNYLLAPDPGPEFDIALEYRLLPDHDNAHFHDSWDGRTGDTDFLIHESKLTETRGSGKNRRTVTVFQGIIIRFHFAREFLGTTLIRRDGFKFTPFGDDKKLGGQVLERIRMVDPHFEDAFDVYASDAVEGRYLVHPEYCERLLELENSFAGEKLCALFFKGDLIVTIHTEDLFESATLDPAQDRELLGRTIGQFASITRLVATLNERARN